MSSGVNGEMITGSTQKVTVSVRIRPINSKEKATGEKIIWNRTSENTIVEVLPSGEDGKSTYFDFVFDHEHSTLNVYEKVAHGILDGVFNGFNGTIFAYGQTSSGKTHTLMGNENEPGVIVLAVRDIFASILEKQNHDFILKMSYIEIYNEEIKDLLATESTEHVKYLISEDKFRGPYVKGIQEVAVTSVDQVLELLEMGEANRHFGATNMNLHSSRSHTLFKMVFESRKLADDQVKSSAFVEKWDDGTPVNVAALNLVDLAGSERISKTGATGMQLKEGSMINKSLLTLGTVISQLSKSKSKGHIPYRDSKLTRLLSTSLGGNARTCMISAISPAESNRLETKSTLKFAERAQRIVNNVTANVVANAQSQLNIYKQEIETLRKKLESSGDENVAQIQKEHLEKQTVLEAQAREEKARAQDASKKLQQMQVLILSAAKFQHKDKKKAHIMQKNLVDVSTGRRRLESIAIVNKDLASFGVGHRPRNTSADSADALKDIDKLRHTDAIDESSSSSNESESDDEMSDDDSKHKRQSRLLAERLTMLVEDSNEQKRQTQVLQGHLENHMEENQSLLNLLSESNEREKSQLENLHQLQGINDVLKVDLIRAQDESKVAQDKVLQVTTTLDVLSCESQQISHKYEALQSEFDNQSTVYQTVVEKLEISQQNNEKLQMVSEKTQIESSDRQQQLETALTRIQDLEDQMISLETHLGQVKDELKISNEELVASRDEKSEMEQDKHQMQDQLNRFQDEMSQKNNELDILKLQVQDRSTEVKQKETVIQDQAQEMGVVKALNEELNRNCRTLESEIEKMQDKYKDELAQNQELISQEKAAMEQLMDEISSLRVQVQDREDLVAEKDVNIENQRREVEDLKTEVIKYERLNQTLEEELETSRNELESEKYEFERKHNTLEMENSKIQRDFEQSRDVVSEQKSELQRLMDELNSLQVNSKDKEVQIAQLSNQNRKQKTEMERLTSEKQNLQRKFDLLKTETEKLRQTCSENAKASTDLKSQLDSAHHEAKRANQLIRDVQSSNKQLKNQLKQRDEVEQQLRMDNDSLKVEHDSLERSHERLITKKATLDAQVTQLRTELLSSQDEIANTRQEAVDLTAQVENLELQNLNFENQMERHVSELSQCKVQLNDLEREKISLNEEIADLLQRLEQLQQEKETADETSHEISTSCVALEAEQLRLRQRVKEYEAELQQLRVSERDTTNKYDKLQHQHEICLRELNCVEISVDRLRKEVQVESDACTMLMQEKATSEKQIREFRVAEKHFQMEIASLESECASISKRNESQNNAYELLTTKLHQSETELIPLRDEYSRLEIVNEELAKRNRILTKQVVEFESEGEKFKQLEETYELEKVKAEELIHSLEIRCDTYLGAKNDLEGKEREARTNLYTLTEETLELKSQARQYQYDKTSLERQIQRLEMNVLEQKSEITTLSAERQTQATELSKSIKIQSQMEKQKAQIETQFENCKQTLASVEKTLQHTLDVAEKDKTRVHAAETQMLELKDRLAALEEQKRESKPPPALIPTLDTTSSSIRLERLVETKTSQCVSLEAALEKLQRIVENLRSRCENTETQLDSCRAELKDKIQEHAIVQIERNSLREQLVNAEEAESQGRVLEEQYNEMKLQCEEMERELSVVRRKAKEMSNDDQLEQLSCALKSTREQISRLSSLNQEFEMKFSKLRDESDEKDEKIQGFESQVQVLGEKNHLLEHELQSILHERNRIHVKSETPVVMGNEFKLKFQQQKDENVLLQKELDCNRKVMSQLKETIEELRKDCDDTRVDCEKQVFQYQEALAKMERQYQRELHQMDHEAKEKRTYDLNSMEERKELSSQVKDLRSEVLRLRPLTTLYESSEKVKDEYEQEVTKLQYKIKRLYDLNVELKLHVELSDEQLTLNQQLLDKVKYEVEKQRKIAKESKDQMIQYKNQLETAKTKLMIREQKIVALKSQSTSLLNQR